MLYNRPRYRQYSAIANSREPRSLHVFVAAARTRAAPRNKGGIANFRFHDLHHTFASYVQMGLGDLRATQLLLGHADPRMTQRYAHLSDERAPRSGAGPGSAPRKWHRPSKWLEGGNRGVRKLPGSIGIQVVDDAGLEPATPGM
jgi:hypothetical protein